MKTTLSVSVDMEVATKANALGKNKSQVINSILKKYLLGTDTEKLFICRLCEEKGALEENGVCVPCQETLLKKSKVKVEKIKETQKQEDSQIKSNIERKEKRSKIEDLRKNLRETEGTKVRMESYPEEEKIKLYGSIEAYNTRLKVINQRRIDLIKEIDIEIVNF